MVSTNETIVELNGLRKKQEEEPPTLSDFDRKLIGGAAVRLEIPVVDAKPHELKRIADLLRGAANHIDFQVDRFNQKNGPTEREMRSSVRMDLLGTRRGIREATPGAWNRNGTVKGEN